MSKGSAYLRPGPNFQLGLTLNTIREHLDEWIAQYGLDGLLTIQWTIGKGGYYEPALKPQHASIPSMKGEQ